MIVQRLRAPSRTLFTTAATHHEGTPLANVFDGLGLASDEGGDSSSLLSM